MSIMEIDGVVSRLEARVKRLEMQVKRQKPSAIPRTDVAMIQDLVAGKFQMSADFMLSSGREQPRAFARQVAMFLIREFVKFPPGRPLPLKSVGLYFGGMDHGTIRSGCIQVKNRMDVDRATCAMVDELRVECLKALKLPANSNVK